MLLPRTEVRLTISWITLIGATVVSLFTGEFGGAAHGVAVAILLALAYAKARLVFAQFVGIGSMPLGWRLFFEGWLLFVITEIGISYWR